MAMSATYTTINGQLVYETRGGVETYYVSDPQGSLIECHDANGNTVYEAWYWPYGEVRTSTGSKVNPWGYIGLKGYLTDLANLLYVRARYYRPDLTRWLTVDPLWPDQPRYIYCANGPTINSDPSGLLSWWGSCILGGGLKGIIVILQHIGGGGGTIANDVCLSVGACLAAILGGAIGTLLGAGVLSGCIAGAIASIAGLVASAICNYFLPAPSCWPKPPPLICDLVAIITGTIAGCLGGWVSGKKIEGFIISVLGSLGKEFGIDSCGFNQS